MNQQRSCTRCGQAVHDDAFCAGCGGSSEPVEDTATAAVSMFKRRDILTGMVAFAGASTIWIRDVFRSRSDNEMTLTSADQPLSAKNDSLARSSGSSTGPGAATIAPAVAPIDVICRDAWGAAPPGEGMIEHTIGRLTIHHSALVVDRMAEGPASVLSHQKFHQHDRSWPDIAYHYLIDPGGNIYQGRDPRFRGDTATEYDPYGHFMLCIDGNFDESPINEAQRSAAARMLAWAAHRYGVEPSTLAGHRDFARTRCPGEALYTLLSDGSLLAEVQRILDTSVPELNLICGDPGENLVDSIEASDA